MAIFKLKRIINGISNFVKGLMNKTCNFLRSRGLIKNAKPLKESNLKVKRFSVLDIMATKNDIRALRDYDDIPNEYEKLVMCCIESMEIYSKISDVLRDLIDEGKVPCLNRVYSLINIDIDRSSNLSDGCGNHARIFEMYNGELEFHYSWDSKSWYMSDSTNNMWYDVMPGKLKPTILIFCSKDNDAMLKKLYELLESSNDFSLINELDTYLSSMIKIINNNL